MVNISLAAVGKSATCARGPYNIFTTLLARKSIALKNLRCYNLLSTNQEAGSSILSGRTASRIIDLLHRREVKCLAAFSNN